MSGIGISLILALVIYLVIRPPSIMLSWLSQLRGSDPAPKQASHVGKNGNEEATEPRTRSNTGENGSIERVNGSRDSAAMPPPDVPLIQPPTIEQPSIQDADNVEEQTTPKAAAAQPAQPVPSFSLSAGTESPKSSRNTSSSEPTSSTSMAPPPLPSNRPPQLRPPRLEQFPAASSPQRASGPIPNRSLAPSGLAPPPTHSSAPQKPKRKVFLEPGHSPLDWARLSADPSVSLNGLSSSGYIRVTPSMLKRQTGRKGKDAWMALNGKVYNVTPYAKFHPGGVPEMMRGAARDGTRLFGEVHPWVNYENMLASCLVGILVDEPESEMDKMD